MNTDTPLRRSLLLAFVLPGIMQGFMHGPESMVQGIYAKHAGLPLVALAGVLLLTRLFDGITYPLIGFLTDRTFRKTGSRKSWILAGTIVTVIGLWFLYRPPAEVTVTYYGIWMAVVYVGWKLTEIPYTAWSFGLSRDYVQRARVQLWRAMAVLSGALIFYTMPYITRALGLTTTTELNLQTLAFTAIIIVVCVPLLNLYSLAKVPDGEAAATQSEKPRQSWHSYVLPVVRNRPLLLLLAAVAPATLAASLTGGTLYLFVSSYLGLGEHYAAIMLLAVPASLLGVPFWGWVCLRFERHRVAAVSIALTGLCFAGQAFVPPDGAGLIPMMILNPLGLFCFMALTTAIPSMVGDIADYGKLQSGEDLSGIYASVYQFMNKSLHGVGAAVGLAIAGYLGFDATAAHQSADGVFAMKLINGWLPLLCASIAAVIMWSFPITRAQQAINQAALKALEEKSAAAS